MTTQETLTEIARLVATLPGAANASGMHLYLPIGDDAVPEYGTPRTVENDGYRWISANVEFGGFRVTASGRHRALVEGTAQEATTPSETP